MIQLKSMMVWTLVFLIVSSFAGSGYVSLKIGPFRDNAYSVALQKNGKIVVAGASHNGVDSDIAIVRFHPTGELDTSFGQKGFVLFDSRLGDDKAYSVHTLDNDSFLVSGCTFNGNDLDIALMKFNADGSRVMDFGKRGIATHDFGPGNDCAYSLYLEENGKIVLGGTASNGKDQDFALARFMPDGTPDLNFGNLGGVTQDLGDSNGNAGNDYVYSIQKDADQNYWISGYSEVIKTSAFTLLRVNDHGFVDTTLRGQGALIPAFGGNYDRSYASVLSPDKGKIVVGGGVYKDDKIQFGLVRYLVNGEVDRRFGNNGYVTSALGSNTATVYSLVAVGKKILAVGQSSNGKNDQITLLRYSEEGAVDTTFGQHGLASLAIANHELSSYGAVVQPDGKIVVAGYLGTTNDYSILVTRFNADGTLDTSFGPTSELLFVHERRRRKSITAEVGLPAFRFLPKWFLGEE